MELTHGPDGPGVLADGRALPVPPHASPTEVGLAAARRHAARSGRELRVEVVDGDSVTLVTVGRHGAVTLLEPPPTGPIVAVPAMAVEPVTEADRTAVHLAPPVVLPVRPPVTPPRTTPPTSVWAFPAPAGRPRRPVSSLVVASLVAVAVLVGAVGTGVATLSSAQALPDACRPVTLYAVGGQGGSSDVLRGVTDPLAKQFGEKVSVVTVPAPPAGGSFASAESEAVGSLATAVGEHVDGCPTGSLMLFGYSQGAQVAGDLASRVGTGLEPRIPAELVQAVGLFGDPARSPRTRAVPDGTTGQGALPARAVGFGSLDARTIEICAPNDPVCDSPPTAAAPPLEQAVISPVHGSYEKLPVAAGTTAPQWAATSLSKVVAALPTGAGPARTPPGTAPQSGSGGATTSEDPDADATGTGTADTGTDATAAPSTGADTATTGSGATGEAGAVTTTPPPGETGAAGDDGSYEGGGSAGASAVTPTNVPSGTSAPGGSDGAEAGAGASTRRSGAASSDGADTSASTSAGSTSAGSTSAGSTGTGSTGTGSTRTGSRGTGSRTSSSGSDTSGTVTSGQGSAETSSPASSRTGTGPTGSSRTGSSGPGSGGTSGTGSSGEYGAGSETGSGSATSGTGSGSAGTRSSTPSSKRPTSGSSSDEPTTTTTAAPSSRSRGGAKTGGKTSKDTGSKGTGASFSLASGLKGFKSTPWNNQGATDPSSAASPNVPGRKAVKFEMPGGGKRTEAEPDIPEFKEGEKTFVGYSGFFDQGFPTNTDTWQLIMQFKQPGTGSPPLAVEVGKGQLRLANDGGGEKDFCPVTQGAFSFQLGVTFGGAVDAWCNGKQTLTGYTTPKSNVQGRAYLKTGIYRDESIKQDSTLFLNDLKVGKTLESVSGLAGAGSGATGATSTTATTADPTAGGTSDQAAGTDPTVPTTAAPATAAPATAALPAADEGSSGTGSTAADANSYFRGGAAGPPLPSPRPRRAEGS
jgi:polysaccharide lyase-like protein/cutinase